VAPLLGSRLVKGMAHITGGGLTDNLPRVLPAGCGARIDRRSWTVPALFGFLQSRGAVSDEDMLRSFNMGIGFVIVCDARAAGDVQRLLADAGESGSRIIGQVEAGERRVRYSA
jgi:phosphoribosylformylglycinamidine cyclo-ligase